MARRAAIAIGRRNRRRSNRSRQLSADVAELKPAGEGALTDTLAQFLSAQYVVAAKAAVRQARGKPLEFENPASVARTTWRHCGGAIEMPGWLCREHEKFAESRKEGQERALEICLEETRKWPDVENSFARLLRAILANGSMASHEPDSTSPPARPVSATQAPCRNPAESRPVTPGHILEIMNLTHNGKIGRLPRTVREQTEPPPRRMAKQGGQLSAWLNSLPEVRAVVAREFGGQPISKQNLSEWRNSGYADWLRQQEALDMARQLAADAGELQPAGAPPLADQMAVWLTARYLAGHPEAGGKETPTGNSDLKVLREFCHDVVALRRGDHSAARLKNRAGTCLERNRGGNRGGSGGTFQASGQ